MKKSYFLICIISILSTSVSSATPTIPLVKLDQASARGQCLRQNTPVSESLNKYNVTTPGAEGDSDLRRQSLSRIFSTLDTFDKKMFTMPSSTEFVFLSNAVGRPSRNLAGNRIEIASGTMNKLKA